MNGCFQLLCVGLSFFLVIFFTPVYGEYLYSSLYRVEGANVNMGSSNQLDSDQYNLSLTLGQTAAGKFESDGYIVKAGFQYFHSIIPFAFSISDIALSLGALQAQVPSTDTTTLTVSFGSAGNYQVTAVEIGPLALSDESASIPDTSCNGDVETCSETLAAVWDSANAYGFGYNMSGNDIPADFTDSTHFRRFPDKDEDETPAIVMTSNNIAEDHTATVTVKANVSPIQQGGTYTTVLNFVATPSF